VALGGVWQRRTADAEGLTYIELRLNRHGDGGGKLSEAADLTVDETLDVIELRDYDRRPLHLLMVRSDRSVEDESPFEE
jgi:hypothetical protein